MLKALKKGEILPVLSDIIIKYGNSLISGNSGVDFNTFENLYKNRLSSS